MAFSPDGQTIAVGQCTIPPRDVVLMDVERPAPVRVRMTGHRYGCTSLAFSPTAATWRPPGAGLLLRQALGSTEREGAGPLDGGRLHEFSRVFPRRYPAGLLRQG